ncbi:ABC transporter permease [Konateibacter massiliensis]|uniref:ABC transporter permease n=1 Tax=Konateibacter massiliensis TaxID=2002841 RepID=UPI000C14C137|nr:ABC transporter permease [Konateibacter massiliensis]
MKEFIKKIQKYYKYTIYSGKAELKSETANSHLSWLWWILDPLLFMLVYSFIALIVFGKGEQYFPAFVFIGLTCWQFFERTVKQSVTLVTKNAQIVTKVYIPKYILIFVKMFSHGFKMFISFCLVLIMMVILRVPISLNILFVIPILLILGVVTFGFSAVLLHFGVFVEDLANVMTVLLKLVFYMSGIFYSIAGRVDEPYATILLKFNPVALIISSMRDCMIYSTTPDLPWLLLWLVVGLVLSCIGVNVIHKYENSYVKVI